MNCNIKQKNILKGFLIRVILLIISFLIMKKELYHCIVYEKSYLLLGIIILKILSIYILALLAFYFIKSSKEIKKSMLKTMSKIILVIVSLWIIFFMTDYFRIKNNKTPIFASDFGGIFTFQDGGTKIYIGLGYKVFYFSTSISYPTYDEMIWDSYPIKGFYLCPLWTSYNEAIKFVNK